VDGDFFAGLTLSSVKHWKRIVWSQENQARHSIVILIDTRSHKTRTIRQPVVEVSWDSTRRFSSRRSR
jgi:hypothetical protein